MADCYRRNPRIEESPLQGDLMLFDPDRSKFFVLNPTMAFLWRNCDGERSFDQVVSAVPDEFDQAEGHAVVQEMQVALDELIALGLVVGS